jgi:hypothetical protein
MCDASGSGTSASRRAESGPLRSTIWIAFIGPPRYLPLRWPSKEITCWIPLGRFAYRMVFSGSGRKWICSAVASECH